jgi:hypothetical protein
LISNEWQKLAEAGRGKIAFTSAHESAVDRHANGCRNHRAGMRQRTGKAYPADDAKEKVAPE